MDNWNYYFSFVLLMRLRPCVRRNNARNGERSKWIIFWPSHFKARKARWCYSIYTCVYVDKSICAYIYLMCVRKSDIDVIFRLLWTVKLSTVLFWKKKNLQRSHISHSWRILCFKKNSFFFAENQHNPCLSFSNLWHVILIAFTSACTYRSVAANE